MEGSSNITDTDKESSTAPGGLISSTFSPNSTPPSLVTVPHKTLVSFRGELSLMIKGKKPYMEIKKGITNYK